MMIDRHVVFIADSKDAKPIGFVGGYSIPHPFNPDIKLLSEMFWWVSEEHRGSRAGLMLLNAFTSYGKEHADWVTMAIEHNSPINERALTKRGYKLQERSYLLEVS